MATSGSRMKPSHVLRLARGASSVCLGFLLLMVVGEFVNPHAPPPTSPQDIIGLFLFPGVYSVGLLLAWRKELLGGSLSLLGMVAFYVWLGLMDGSLPRGWILPLLALPAGLFILFGLCRTNPSEGMTK